MGIKFADYVKLENMKHLILSHLEGMGLKEQVRVMHDEDIDKIINLMCQLSKALNMVDNSTKESNNEKRIEMLVAYVVGLWCRLIVDYGADMGEL